MQHPFFYFTVVIVEQNTAVVSYWGDLESLLTLQTNS